MLELANICHMPKLKALSDKYRRRVYLTVALTNTHTQNCVALKLLDTVGHIPRKCLFVNFQRMCSVAVALFVSCADFPLLCVDQFELHSSCAYVRHSSRLSVGGREKWASFFNFRKVLGETQRKKISFAYPIHLNVSYSIICILIAIQLVFSFSCEVFGSLDLFGRAAHLISIRNIVQRKCNAEMCAKTVQMSPTEITSQLNARNVR